MTVTALLAGSLPDISATLSLVVPQATTAAALLSGIAGLVYGTLLEAPALIGFSVALWAGAVVLQCVTV